MPSRGRPPKHDFYAQLRFVALRAKARHAAWRLATEERSRNGRNRRLLEELPAELRKCVEEAAAKHRRYVDPLIRKYDRHAPKDGETWRLCCNYRPTGGTKEQEQNWYLLNSWREDVYGPEMAKDVHDLVVEGWRKEGVIKPLWVVRYVAPPDGRKVGRIFGRIDAAIARIAGVSSRTLRQWCKISERQALIGTELSPSEVGEPLEQPATSEAAERHR